MDEMLHQLRRAVCWGQDSPWNQSATDRKIGGFSLLQSSQEGGRRMQDVPCRREEDHPAAVVCLRHRSFNGASYTGKQAR